MFRSLSLVFAVVIGGALPARAQERDPAAAQALFDEARLLMNASNYAAADLPVRVVSMPSSTVFDRQDAAYRDSVLTPGLPRVAVEAGVTDFWRKYVGLQGAVVGLDRFGESAPASDLFKHFGITAEHVEQAVRSVIP
jgi:transketolase